MLAVTDYEITEAETGEEALAAIAKQRPDLILMDIQLPTMDGYEATRRIKADASLRSIPIVAVVGLCRALQTRRELYYKPRGIRLRSTIHRRHSTEQQWQKRLWEQEPNAKNRVSMAEAPTAGHLSGDQARIRFQERGDATS
jgi:CheY-like chemotaxis protein